MDKIKTWIRENTKEFVLLVLILSVGAFLRLYKIDAYMTFLGDEGRDVIIVRRFLTELHPPLIGPGTSIGNMYLGPIYYYMMAPSLLLANFSPVGPAVAVAFLGVATVFFVWFIGREWFSAKAGLIASALYAISPTVIVYSRSSWNPNIMPFFSLLSIYSIWRVWNNHEFKWLIVLGMSFACVLQSHYLGLLLAPTFIIFWLLTFKELKSEKREFIKYSAVSIILFLLLMSPLVIFDIRHGWHNFAAMKEFFTARQSTVSIRPWNAIPNLWPIFQDIITRLPGGRNAFIGAVGALILVFSVVFLFVKKKIPGVYYKPLILIASWFGFGLLGLGLYKQQIYDHYYGFFFAVPFLIAGLVLGIVFNSKNKISIFLGAIFLGIIIFVNFRNSPILTPPNYQLQRAEVVANKIEEESKGERFNLAVIAERNYQAGYEYFLLKDKYPVIDIDAQKPETITNQLFAVCEMAKDKCTPTNNPRAEVANFGWSKVENQWDIFGVTIYKLVHTQKK